MCLGQGTPTLVLTDWALHASGMDLCKVYQGHLESLKHPFSFYLSFVPPRSRKGLSLSLLLAESRQ